MLLDAFSPMPLHGCCAASRLTLAPRVPHKAPHAPLGLAIA